MFRGLVTQRFASTPVELVFDLLGLLVGERVDVAAFREVLAQQVVEVFVATTLPRRVRRREVAVGVEGNVHAGARRTR